MGLAVASLAIMAGGCTALPPATVRPGAAEQNVPPTVAFTTTRVAPAIDGAPGKALSTPVSDCPGVDSLLLQVLASSDPLAQAKQLQLRTKDNQIQVVVVVSQQDTGFLRDYGAEIGSQSGERVQVFMPLNRICELAKSGKVLAIDLPSQASIQ
jgi:hypothetical protein